MKPIMVEFFSGSGYLAKEFKEIGYDVLCVDNTYAPEDKSLRFIKKDILSYTCREEVIADAGGIPSFMHFGTICTGFSVAAISHHWAGGYRAYVPKSDMARLSLSLVKKSLEIISWFPETDWSIENPRGLLRKMDFMPNDKRFTISFCRYGDTRMKPTDIWTSLKTWWARPMCKNNNPNCHHERAPRGAKTGTQGLKGSYARSKYPLEFCREFADAAKRAYNSSYANKEDN